MDRSRVRAREQRCKPAGRVSSAGVCCLPSRACASQYRKLRHGVGDGWPASWLHETLEALYGAPGWAALVSLWQEAPGIQQPKRQPKPVPIPPAEPHGKPDTPLPLSPGTLPRSRKVCIRRFPGCPRELPHFCYTRRKIRLPSDIRRAKAKGVKASSVGWLDAIRNEIGQDIPLLTRP